MIRIPLPLSILGAVALLLAPAADATESQDSRRTLNRRAATRALDEIRHAMPTGWENRSVKWDQVPAGWRGEPECVRIEVAPGWSTPADALEIVFWILPPCWEGRMEVADLGAVPSALYLGENSSFRVLYETGRHGNLWPDAPQVLGELLALTTYPLTPRPEHRLDVEAMQTLFVQLTARSDQAHERWMRQIYGIEELDRLLYLELLTWDQRDGADDPTWLGDLAERETDYLSREALAAFPDKHGLYLRRVTADSFSDVIVINPAKNGP